MYRGLGTVGDPISVIDPNDIILGPELTPGPYIPPPNSGTATALLNASIAANAPSLSQQLQFGLPTWALMAGVGIAGLALLGGRRR